MLSSSRFEGALDVARRPAPCIIIVLDSESEEEDPKEDSPPYYPTPSHRVIEFPEPIQALPSSTITPHQSSLEVEVFVHRRGLEALAAHVHRNEFIKKPALVLSSSSKKSFLKEYVASLRRGLEALTIYLKQEDLVSPIIRTPRST